MMAMGPGFCSELVSVAVAVTMFWYVLLIALSASSGWPNWLSPNETGRGAGNAAEPSSVPATIR